MGFFKDFADDLSEAVDELIPGTEEENPGEDDDLSEVGSNEKIESDMDVAGELTKLDGLLEKVAKKVEAEETPEGDVRTTAPKAPETEKKEDPPRKEAASPAPPEENTANRIEKETRKMENENITRESAAPASVFEVAPASDENAVITSGMRITGDLESTGSIEVEGTISGNVRCNGKLTVTGVIQGNTTSSEFFADSAKMEGEVSSSGTVKVGVGSVIIGNITASSAVIAGAVKGDIDVQGPVVVDTSAVVMGNIKSRSVQINNGAVIEGFCSQAYAEVDVASVFS